MQTAGRTRSASLAACRQATRSTAAPVAGKPREAPLQPWRRVRRQRYESCVTADHGSTGPGGRQLPRSPVLRPCDAAGQGSQGAQTRGAVRGSGAGGAAGRKGSGAAGPGLDQASGVVASTVSTVPAPLHLEPTAPLQQWRHIAAALLLFIARACCPSSYTPHAQPDVQEQGGSKGGGAGSRSAQ